MLKNWKSQLAAIVIIVAAGLVVYYWFCWRCPTTVIVLRHAEKVTVSPPPDDNLVPLTQAGQDRAETLAQVLGDAGVTKIFVTEKLRTQQTAAPLAAAEGLTAVQINKADTAQLINEATSWANRGRVMVIVGHSDTVPDIVAQLGGGMVAVGETEFDNLFVLTLHQPSARIIKATYGEPR